MREHTRSRRRAHGRHRRRRSSTGSRSPARSSAALPRFRALAALGLDFVHVIPGSTGMPRELGVASVLSLAREIVPALRA